MEYLLLKTATVEIKTYSSIYSSKKVSLVIEGEPTDEDRKEAMKAWRRLKRASYNSGNWRACATFGQQHARNSCLMEMTMRQETGYDYDE